MEYAEYKGILNKAMVDYVNGGGSVFHMGSVTKEYIFDYEDTKLPIENKHNLENKAIQAMMKNQPLPKGIRLLSCVWQKG